MVHSKNAWKPGWYGWDKNSEDGMAWGPEDNCEATQSHPSVDHHGYDDACDFGSFFVMDCDPRPRILELEAKVKELQSDDVKEGIQLDTIQAYLSRAIVEMEKAIGISLPVGERYPMEMVLKWLKQQAAAFEIAVIAKKVGRDGKCSDE